MVQVVLGAHTHGANPAHLEAAKIITAMKGRAASTMETPTQIINSACQVASSSTLGHLLQKNSLRKTVQRVRNRGGHAPVLPANCASLVIPQNYTQYTLPDGSVENFVLADSGVGDRDRILIFGRSATATWIGNVNKLYVDGTFSLSPIIFSQVFILSAERGGFVFPILFALLPDKTEDTYRRMFTYISAAWSNFRPQNISLDFEAGLINAARTVFPVAALDGCLFHLTQNVKKHLRQLGLFKRYTEDPDFALLVRMIPAIAFVPPQEIEDAFSELSNIAPVELVPLLDYFEDTYIGRLARNGRRRPPLFPHTLWNVYHRTISGVGRTNNFAEAANRQLQQEFGVDHPTIFKFIDGLKRYQSNRDKIYEDFVAGKNPTEKRLKYVQADNRIMVVVNSWGQRTPVEYLPGIAYNFLLN